MIVKQSKNWYTWLGKENLLLTLAKMRVCMCTRIREGGEGEGENRLREEIKIHCFCPHRQWLRMIQTSDTCIKRTASRFHQNQLKTPTHPHHFPTRPTFPQIPPPLRKDPYLIPTKIKHLMLLSQPSPVTLHLILLPKTHPVMTKICRTHSNLPLCVRRGCHHLCVVHVGVMEMVEGGTSLLECSVKSLSCSF